MSSSVRAGPPITMRACGPTASRTRSTSPAEATSKPLTEEARARRTCGSLLALTAEKKAVPVGSGATSAPA